MVLRTRKMDCSGMEPVVFSDESRFNLSSDDNRVRVWRPGGERLNPAFDLNDTPLPQLKRGAWKIKKFEDAELQALLDEDDGQTQEHLAEQLNVDQSTISRRLKAMGKIINVVRSVPHVLTDRQQENRKIVCEMLLARYKRKSYLHRIVTGD
ncbi:mariner Mos1 transposase [Trichonephila clavipes]|nr:mariner Mos1 transposase [Trichonephila clavipes]